MKAKEIVPVIELPKNKVIRSMNSMLLSRIFGNIIGNALKYTDRDFSVVLKEDGSVCFSNTAKQLSITVRFS